MKISVIVAAAFVLMCCGGGMFLLSQVTDGINDRAKDAISFGDLATKQILSTYDAKKLVALATPEYREAFKATDFQEILDGNKKALGEYRDGTGSARLRKATVEGKSPIVRMQYSNKAEFEKGQATVVMELAFLDKKWQIDKFAIEPR